MSDWDALDRQYGSGSAPAESDSWDKLDAKHSKVKKAAELMVANPANPIGFAGNLQFATPLGTVDTGIAMPEFVNRRLAQLGSGFADVGLGVRQLLAGKSSDAALRQEAADKRATDVALNSDFTGKALNFTGKVLPTLPVPVGWARAAGAAAPIIEGAVLGGMSGAIDPVAGNESRGLNTAIGAVGGSVIPAAIAGVRAISRPANADLVRLAEKYQIPVGITDTTNNKMLKAARSIGNDLPITGTIGAAQNDAKQQAFNRAVGGTFGASEGKLTPDVMDAAKKRLGSEFDRIWNGNNLNLDPQFLQAVQSLRAEAGKLPQGEGTRLAGWVDDVLSQVQTGPGGQAYIPGEVANRFQSSIRKQSESATGFLADNLKNLRGELIGAFNRSVAPADAAALTANRSAYKNFKTVEPLLDKGALGTAGRELGDIPGALLPEAVRRSFSGVSSQTNQPALAELARVGSGLLADRTPQTGGSARALIQNTGLLAGLGLGVASPTTAAVGVPLAAAGQWALGSPAVRKLLTSTDPQRSIMAAPLSIEVKKMLLDAVRNGASTAPAVAAGGLLSF